MDEPLEAWFAREILPLKGALTRYLSRTWWNREDIGDLRQDIYVRVYDAAMKSRPLAPKAFLFTTARNLLTDRIRRRRIVSIEATGDLDSLNVSVDEISPEQITSAHQDLRRLAEAFDLLPAKCREVVWMRKVEELSQKQVAVRMGITEGAVEKHITKGIRLLAKTLFRGVEMQTDARSSDEETQHGKQLTD